MALADPAAARWPDVAGDRAHYESYYVRAVDPAGGRGVWIRYTVSIAPGGRLEGQLWFILFDRTAAAPRAVRVDAGRATAEDGWIRLGDSTFGPLAIDGRAGAASWSLRCRNAKPVLEHLPREWMYRTRLPRTKLLSLSPAAVFDGTVEVDGESIAVAGWPGMTGRNWGEQHADEWIWLHGLGFEGAAAGTWLDVVVGRVRIRRVVTPWTANGTVCLGGERIRVGGHGRRVTVDAGPDRCRLRLPSTIGPVTAAASAPSRAFVAWGGRPDAHRPPAGRRAGGAGGVGLGGLRVGPAGLTSAHAPRTARQSVHRSCSTSGPCGIRCRSCSTSCTSSPSPSSCRTTAPCARRSRRGSPPGLGSDGGPPTASSS